MYFIPQLNVDKRTILTHALRLKKVITKIFITVFDLWQGITPLRYFIYVNLSVLTSGAI